MNLVLKIVLTFVMMLVWAIGKEVAQKVQGSDYGLLTWVVSIICLWIISDMWFFNTLFFKNNEKGHNSVKNDNENKSYLKTINVEHSMLKKQVNKHVEIKKQNLVKQSEIIMNNKNEDMDADMINEDELYLQATNEVDDKNQEKALWAKCMALSEGDENKAKYKYIKERVERLRDVKVKEIEERQKQEIERVKAIEQQKMLEEEKIRNDEIKRAKDTIERMWLEEEIKRKQEIKQEKFIDKQKKIEEENFLKKILNENNYTFYKDKHGPYVFKKNGEDKAQIFKTEEEFKNFIAELLPKLNKFVV